MCLYNGMCLRRIAFVLGSGISYLTLGKDSSAYDLTQKILSDPWMRHSSGVYHKRNNKKSPEVTAIQKWLSILFEYHEFYLKRKREGLRKTTYEDLYSICNDLRSEHIGRNDNLIASAFYNIFYDQLCVLSKDFKGEFMGVGDLGMFLDECCTFIQTVVVDKLRTEENPKGLNFISEVCLSDRYDQIDIYTLNHDLLIENELKNKNIDFIDGFQDCEEGNVRIEDIKILETDAKVRLIKLHGSIDWVDLRDKNDRRVVGSIKEISRDQYYKFNNVIYTEVNRYILTGTYNKLISYHYGFIHRLHRIFQNDIELAERVIVSGYGWNDTGINAHLEQYTSMSETNKILILHQNPDELKSSKSKHFEEKNPRNTVFINEWLSHTKIENVKDYI